MLHSPRTTLHNSRGFLTTLPSVTKSLRRKEKAIPSAVKLISVQRTTEWTKDADVLSLAYFSQANEALAMPVCPILIRQRLTGPELICCVTVAGGAGMTTERTLVGVIWTRRIAGSPLRIKEVDLLFGAWCSTGRAAAQNRISRQSSGCCGHCSQELPATKQCLHFCSARVKVEEAPQAVNTQIFLLKAAKERWGPFKTIAAGKAHTGLDLLHHLQAADTSLPGGDRDSH